MDLIEDIKIVIDQYVAAHRTRSLATLARLSGVSYTTLRRMSQREGTPTAEPVLKVIDVTLDGEERAAFLRRHFPEIARSIGPFAAEPMRGGQSNAVLQSYYARDPHCVVILLARNNGGTTLGTIRRLCGDPGERALAELAADGLVEVDYLTGKVELLAGSATDLDIDVVLNCIRATLNRFDRGLLGTKAARACHLGGSIDEEGLRRIHQIATDAITRIIEIKEDSRFFGTIPFFYNAFLNVYDRSALSGSTIDPPETHDALQ